MPVKRKAVQVKPQPEKFKESEVLEHKGLTFTLGDVIKIEGIGECVFKGHTVNLDLETEWITVFQPNRGYRAARLERIKLPRQSKLRKPRPDPASSSLDKTQVCPVHPKYGAVRKPRTDCPRCLAAYEARRTS